jgi:uncharacterized membrane protein
MRNLLWLAAPLAALTVLAGCNNSPEGGTPGTRNSFTLKGPTLTTTIKQGDTQTVTLTVDRDSEFKQTVKLTVQEPTGIDADLSKTQVTSADPKDVALTIRVAKDAALGDHVVKVTGTPVSGGATRVDVKVMVEAGPKG